MAQIATHRYLELMDTVVDNDPTIRRRPTLDVNGVSGFLVYAMSIRMMVGLENQR